MQRTTFRMNNAAYAWLLPMLLIAWAMPVYAEQADRDKPIDLEADSVIVDDAKQISTYSGNVILSQGSLVIHADTLVVREDSSGFQHSTALGNPTGFKQKIEGKNEYMEGSAKRIEYDGRMDKVQLFGKASVKRGDNIIQGEYISYDANAEYAHVLEIDMDQLKEPVLCCPNDPDDAKLLSDVAGTKIDEVFIGSCMTNIGHFRAASKLLEGRRDIPVKLWIAPPTKMDAAELTKEGHYGVFGAAGARTEMPGCSLCMGNQAQVREGATVVSTSTRNFPNRLGKNTNVYLASSEVAAISSKLGRIPTTQEYQASMTEINKDGSQIYKYMNFDKIEEYADVAKGVAA